MSAEEEKVEVLICGSGSAGIAAAAYLARCGVRCKVLETRSGPLEIGKADGVQCRTVEIFESFGLADELLREAYHVLETTFWSSDGNGRLVCTKRIADTAPGLSHQPHVILNQSSLHNILIGAMKKWNGQGIDYGYSVKAVEVDSRTASDSEAYPVKVITERDGQDIGFRAKYVLGCDGAHSAVRKSLGFKMVGDSSDSIWGVVDCYPRTDFPDIRKKTAIQSLSGSLLIIPRENPSLVRLYIEQPEGIRAKDVTLEGLYNTARRIFHPYQLDVADTFWWSAYAIGQRLADHFSKDNRVFLTGDACHTHGPKAGQGMNTSLQDGYNIGWKLASILKGQVGPELLLTYNLEREKVAADLINFDRELTSLFSSKAAKLNGKSARDFSDYFVKAGRYTAGLTATYADSSITCTTRSAQDLARNIVVGMRLPSAQVVRFCDARAMQLVRAIPADGRWRIVVFAGNLQNQEESDRLTSLGEYLISDAGPVRLFTPSGADVDSFIETIVVLSGARQAIEQNDIHQYFCPITGKWQTRDLHKIFIDDDSYNSGHGRAYDTFGIDPTRGAIAIVRPDQYVSMIIDVGNHEALGTFFQGFCRSSRKPTTQL